MFNDIEISNCSILFQKGYEQDDCLHETNETYLARQKFHEFQENLLRFDWLFHSNRVTFWRAK